MGLHPPGAAGHAAAAAVHLHLRPQRRPAHHLPRRGRPHDDRAGQDHRHREARDPRRGGRRLLPAPGHRPPRHRARGLDRPRAARHGAGRQHDHPAGREERLRRHVPDRRGRRRHVHRSAALDRSEGPRGAPRRQARVRADEGPDPRHVPEHDLLRTRRVRDPGGGEDLLRRRRGRAHRARRPPCWPASCGRPGSTTPPSRATSKVAEGPPQLRPRPDGGERLARRHAGHHAEGAEDPAAPGARHLQHARRLRVLRRVHEAPAHGAIRRREGLRRRPARDDDDRPRAPARRRGGRPAAPPHARGSGRRRRHDRRADRADPGDGRREELREEPGEPRDRRGGHRPAGGLGLQAVHAGRRHGRRLRPAQVLERDVAEDDPRQGVLHGRQAVDAVERLRRGERHVHAEGRHRVLGQHGLRRR